MTARLMTFSKRTPQQGAPSASRGTLSVPAAPADGRCAETQRDPGVPAGWPHRAARLPAWGTLPAPPHLRSRGAFFLLPALAGEASLRPAQPNSAEGEPTRAPLRPSAIRPARLFTETFKGEPLKRSPPCSRGMSGARLFFRKRAYAAGRGIPDEGRLRPAARAGRKISSSGRSSAAPSTASRAEREINRIAGGSPFHRIARSSG